MKTNNLLFLLTVFIISAPYAPVPVAADDVPVMTVTFDRESVAYEEELAAVVSEALNANDSAVFEVVTVVPAPNQVSRRREKRQKKRESRNGRAVLESIKANGVEENNIKLRFEQDPSAAHTVVKVYIQ